MRNLMLAANCTRLLDNDVTCHGGWIAPCADDVSTRVDSVPNCSSVQQIWLGGISK
jgi:hypothetical protein